jgi:hypothetical protein
MSSYSDKLRDPRWQKCRLQIMDRDGFRCHECGTESKTLHVHHTRYLKGVDPWDYPVSLLITLCEDCHQMLHDGASVTGAESLLCSVVDRGGNSAVLWMLSAWTDMIDPPDRKFTKEEWEAAARAFRETLESFARGER